MKNRSTGVMRLLSGLTLSLFMTLSACSKLSPKSIATNGFSLFGNSALSAMGCNLLINSDLTISPGVNYDTDLVSCNSDVDVTGSGPVLSENSNPAVDPENILVRWREKTVNGVSKKVLNLKGFTVVANWAKRYKVTIAAAEVSVRVVSGNYILSDQLEVFDSKVLGSAFACNSSGVSGYYTFKCPRGSLPKAQLVVTNQVIGGGVTIPVPSVVPYCELWRIADNATSGITPQSVQAMLPSMTFPNGSLGLDRLSCIAGTQQGSSVSLIPALTADGLFCTDVLGTASAPVAAPSAAALAQFFKTSGAACTAAPSGTGTAAPGGGGVTTVPPDGSGTAAPGGGGGVSQVPSSDPSCIQSLSVTSGTTTADGYRVRSVQLSTTGSQVSATGQSWTISPTTGIAMSSSSTNPPQRTYTFSTISAASYTVTLNYVLSANSVACSKSIVVNVPAAPGQPQ